MQRYRKSKPGATTEFSRLVKTFWEQRLQIPDEATSEEWTKKDVPQPVLQATGLEYPYQVIIRLSGVETKLLTDYRKEFLAWLALMQ